MFIATAVVCCVLAAMVLLSAWGKARRTPALIEQLTAVGVSSGQVPLLAGAEVAGAIGLLVGLAWAPLGIAAAAGLVVYFVGAVTAHLRAGQRNITAPLPFLVASLAALVLRALTA